MPWYHAWSLHLWTTCCQCCYDFLSLGRLSNCCGGFGFWYKAYATGKGECSTLVKYCFWLPSCCARCPKCTLTAGGSSATPSIQHHVKLLREGQASLQWCLMLLTHNCWALARTQLILAAFMMNVPAQGLSSNLVNQVADPSTWAILLSDCRPTEAVNHGAGGY